MATAWIDKDSDGVENTVQAVINGSRIVVTVDPLPENVQAKNLQRRFIGLIKALFTTE